MNPQMTELSQEFEFAAVRSGSAGSGRAKDTCGPNLPFGHAIDLANAASQSGHRCKAQYPPGHGRQECAKSCPPSCEQRADRPLSQVGFVPTAQ